MDNNEEKETKEALAWRMEVREVYHEYRQMTTEITPHTTQLLWRRTTVLLSTLYLFNSTSPYLLDMTRAVHFLSFVRDYDPNNHLHFVAAMAALARISEPTDGEYNNTFHNNE
jgi:hypothetical protein